VYKIPRDRIDAQREQRYHRTPALRLQTPEDAQAFVREVGFCHFWPIKGIELPNLFHAIAGRVRSVPMAHDDPDLSKSWTWKDRALGQGWWYYGKLLRRRATMVSLDLLPAFYACSENYGGLDDYLEEYRAGTMTAEAKQIYEALLEHGPLDTVRLRREARLAAESAKSRFERALTELQVGLKVLPIGVAEAGAWRYAFVYEIVQRYLPDLPDRARPITRGEARRTLVSRYLRAVIAAEQGMIGRVFHVLHWTPAELERTIRALLEEGTVRRVDVEGGRGPQLAWAQALEGREPLSPPRQP
jgi:hypothetical protein